MNNEHARLNNAREQGRLDAKRKMRQPDLIDIEPPFDVEQARKLVRAQGPATSRQAAREIVRQLPALHRRVLDMVRKRPGNTCNELALLSNLRDNRTIGRRLPELEAKGVITRGPARPCKVTGRMAVTWTLTEEGES